MKRAAVLAIVFSIACACDSREKSAPPDETKALGGDIAARVGETAIPVSLVAKVAEVQKIAPREALQHLVEDAVAAEAARSRHLDRELPESWLLTAVNARFTADHWAREARAMGPPNDEEIAAVSKIYWQSIDRPAAAATVHAVVQPKKKGNAADEEAARRVADAIHEAVKGAPSVDEFTKLARAVEAPPNTIVTVQPIPAVTADGRGFDNQTYHLAFTKAANELVTPGDLSPVTESPDGFHVIRLVEKIPARVMPLEERRVALAIEVYDGRARSIRDRRLEELKKQIPVAVETSAETTIRNLKIPSP